MRHEHRIIAALYDRMLESAERTFLGQLRAEIVGLAAGTVIEIGAGTGRNVLHYRAAAVRRLDAVEPDPHMWRRAAPRAAVATFPLHSVQATAEQLPFADAYADTVVGTLVLCSVDRPDASLHEIRRVLKPSGRLLFIEHVRSADSWRAHLQDWITPLWRRVAGNCHVNRNSLSVIQAAGFTALNVRHVAGGPWGNPIVAGIATPSR